MSGSITATRQGNAFRVLPALFLVFAAGCEVSNDMSAQSADVSPEEANWKLVEAYVELDTAWHNRDDEINRSDDSADEKDRRRREERGEHPDIVLAVAAARAIVDDGGQRALDAAKFLVEHPAGLSPTAESDIAFGNASLARLIGPDWSVVEAYHDAMQAWRDDDEARRESFKAEAENAAAEDGVAEVGATGVVRLRVATPFVLVPPPEALEATAAAQAILDAADHERARDAAEFLVENAMRNPDALITAARWLTANASDFDDWPNVLMRLARGPGSGDSGPFGEFLQEMAADAADPVVRATARYFAASAVAGRLNNPSADAGEREAGREQALAMATGLSEGVEDEEFVKKVSVDGEQVAQTMSQAEASLVHGIRHTLVGSTVADEIGNRLDGSEDSLSAYAGKVVLMDFWATWCGPCIAALPNMRDLADAHPDDRFDILGISVDADLETVTEFMEDEPMPWSHWHIGVGSELGLSWNIAGYPTYVVVGADGVIRSRGHDLDAAIEIVDEALADGPTAS